MKTYIEYFNLSKDPFLEISENTPKDILSESETESYINKSLAEAGMKEKIFQETAIRKVYSYSRGDSKLIHEICSYALQRTYFIHEKTVHKNLLTECLELLLESKPPDIYPEDKRRHKRINTEFPGTFHIQGTETRGTLTVSNISYSGILIKLSSQRLLKNNDRISVSFKLDNEKQSDIRTVVIVRHTFGFYAGCLFNYLDSNECAECLELLLESKPPDVYPNDKRRHKRLNTDFPGTFHIQGTKTRGTLTVSNISYSGILIKLNRQRLLKNNDRISVSFKLDDEKQSDIRTVVIVRHTFGFYAGCLFNYLDSNDYNEYITDILKRRNQHYQKH
jgi:hypothetical protein